MKERGGVVRERGGNKFKMLMIKYNWFLQGESVVAYAKVKERDVVYEPGYQSNDQTNSS